MNLIDKQNLLQQLNTPPRRTDPRYSEYKTRVILEQELHGLRSKKSQIADFQNEMYELDLIKNRLQGEIDQLQLNKQHLLESRQSDMDAQSIIEAISQTRKDCIEAENEYKLISERLNQYSTEQMAILSDAIRATSALSPGEPDQ